MLGVCRGDQELSLARGSLGSLPAADTRDPASFCSYCGLETYARTRPRIRSSSVCGDTPLRVLLTGELGYLGGRLVRRLGVVSMSSRASNLATHRQPAIAQKRTPGGWRPKRAQSKESSCDFPTPSVRRRLRRSENGSWQPAGAPSSVV